MNASDLKDEDTTLISTDLRPRSFFQVWSDWALAFVKFLGKKIHSPLGIYFIFTWIISIVIMGTTNTLRGEGDEEFSFRKGPSYWMNVFLTFGLNEGQEPGLRFIAKSGWVWFFAPMVAILLGVTLYMLPESGFFRNGALPSAEGDFAQSHMFFSESNIWGTDLINASKPKWVLMYIWIVMMPIILGAALAGTYNFIVFKKVLKRQYLPKIKLLIIIVFISAIGIGISLALMTGDIELRFRDFFYSLFVNRRENGFLIYGLQYQEIGNQGQYHPIGIALVIMLIYFVPFFIIYGIFLLIGNLDNIWKNRSLVFDKISESIKSRKTLELDIQKNEE